MPEKFNVLVITLSDRASSGEYEDLSGPAVVKHISGFMNKEGWKYEIRSELIPDNAGRLKELILSKAPVYDIIITTGGTGIGPKDITVDVVKPLLSKEIPGIMELIRVKYGLEKPNALLSRSIAGLIDRTLIYTLPGSVKAVDEYMSEILKTLEHTLNMLYGVDKH